MLPAPSFNTWTIVFLIAAAQGYFVAAVLFRWRRGDPAANRLLAALVTLFSLTLTEYVLYWTNYIYLLPHVANLTAHFPFLFGPLVYWYLRRIYEHRSFQPVDLWHLLPFGLAMGSFVFWFLAPSDLKVNILAGKASFPISRWVYFIILWGRIASMAAYAVWNWLYIRRQSSVALSTPWALRLNGFFAGFLLAYASYFILVRFSFFNLLWDYHISATMTAFIYLIAYAGYAQPAVFEGFAWTDPEAPVKYRNSGLTPEASRSLLLRLHDVMREQRLYRDPELNLEGLASRLGASKHHVSQVINEHLGASFFEFINHLRIEEAKKMLAETTRGDLHVIEAAYAVGFNNKVSFNAAFKKATGMTPTEYRKSHSSSDNADATQGAVGESR
ncbi:MAG: AraC family transcriptional regulator [Saprospiraceae bacterium]|nr:AraC family transcriptional regulator [Saprospiraceae bacterium]